jgi:hypothetical protein
VLPVGQTVKQTQFEFGFDLTLNDYNTNRPKENIIVFGPWN